MRTHEEQIKHVMEMQRKQYAGINAMINRYNREEKSMTLKERIEAMKLPGHNGPTLRKRSVQNPRLIAKLAKRVADKVEQ